MIYIFGNSQNISILSNTSHFDIIDEKENDALIIKWLDNVA